jgi:hypothetical protein
MNKEFVMRGQTASGKTELLEFGGRKPGYGYKLTEFQLWTGSDLHGSNYEASASITAGKTGLDPVTLNFNNEALIGCATVADDNNTAYPANYNSIINDTFLITQNLILLVMEQTAGAPVNWQCRFKAVKLNSSQEAVANYKQYNIFDD